MVLDAYALGELQKRVYAKEPAKQRNEENGILLVYLECGCIYYLNSTARWIYEKIDGEKSVGEIIHEAVMEYGVEENQISLDVLNVIENMRRTRMARIKGGRDERSCGI